MADFKPTNATDAYKATLWIAVVHEEAEIRREFRILPFNLAKLRSAFRSIGRQWIPFPDFLTLFICHCGCSLRTFLGRVFVDLLDDTSEAFRGGKVVCAVL